MQAPKTYQSETESTLGCFTNRAKCMTLSVLETSLPMQRSHDTLAASLVNCMKELNSQQFTLMLLPDNYIVSHVPEHSAGCYGLFRSKQ